MHTPPTLSAWAGYHTSGFVVSSIRGRERAIQRKRAENEELRYALTEALPKKTASLLGRVLLCNGSER